MKTKQWAGSLLASTILITLTGCSMNDSNDIPSSGTRSLDDAKNDAQKVSSEILDLIKIKGKSSKVGPGVSTCDDKKDSDKFFRIRHPWGFTPDSPDQLPDVMKRLKEELPRQGWKITEYEHDASPNKNLNLTADNNKKKFGVNIIYYAKDDTPYLGITVVSGCYQVPKGQRVDQY